MRLENLRQKMADDQLDGFLVTQPDNRRYLSGFTGSAGVLLVSAGRHGLATDSRYYQQVKQQCPDWELLEVGYGFAKAMSQRLAEFGLTGKRVGFEAADITVAALQVWQDALDGQAELVPTEGVVESLRMRKESGELAAMQKAIDLADKAWSYIAGYIEPGKAELDVAWALESYMRTHGAQALSFESIVASGPNTAKPHARPSDRKISAGEPITLDFGCVVDGYCSDITRSFCLNAPGDDRYLEVWNTVQQAQQAAIDGAQAGMTGAAVDALAREVIKQAGYGEFFGHGLGHSLGLAVHENPRYSFTYDGVVPAGAVMTVEPGIYIPDWGGVRLEDVVLVEENGVRLLSAAPKVAVI